MRKMYFWSPMGITHNAIGGQIRELFKENSANSNFV